MRTGRPTIEPTSIRSTPESAPAPAYPETARERDLWIRGRRGPRRTLDPWRAYGAFVEEEVTEAGVLEQPQVWSLPADGGRTTKHAELRGEIAGAAFSPRGRLAYVGLDDPSFSGATNLGLWVREGSRARRLGEELDRTFLFIVIGDLVDFGALAPVPVLWLDDQNVVVPVTDRGSCVPYRLGLDGSTERLVERDDAVCTWLAYGGGRLATIASIEGGACVGVELPASA